MVESIRRDFPKNSPLSVLWGLALFLGWQVPAQAELPHSSQGKLNSHSSVVESLSFTPPLGSANDYLPQEQFIEDTYLVLRLSERTLYLYNRNSMMRTYPVAIGREGWETPRGRFTIFQMQQNPTWEHPFTGELIPPGDDNPLGQRWLGFWSDGTNAIGFHGTPDTASVGQAISHGCVRLYNHDVVDLYDRIALGTPVYVVP
jgi:L,D-transpeptidase ErfK/SrfK